MISQKSWTVRTWRFGWASVHAHWITQLFKAPFIENANLAKGKFHEGGREGRLPLSEGQILMGELWVAKRSRKIRKVRLSPEAALIHLWVLCVFLDHRNMHGNWPGHPRLTSGLGIPGILLLHVGQARRGHCNARLRKSMQKNSCVSLRFGLTGMIVNQPLATLCSYLRTGWCRWVQQKVEWCRSKMTRTEPKEPEAWF